MHDIASGFRIRGFPINTVPQSTENTMRSVLTLLKDLFHTPVSSPEDSRAAYLAEAAHLGDAKRRRCEIEHRQRTLLMLAPQLTPFIR